MFKIAFVLFGLMVLGCVYSYYHPQDPYYNRYLPAEIEVSQILAYGSEFRLLEGCGAVIYELSPAMAKKLNDKGASMLKTGMQPRGISDFRFAYGDWRPTPVASVFFSRFIQDDEGYTPMMCADLGGWEEKVRNIAAKAGGVYTFDDHSLLLLEPEEKLAVFLYEK
ncbi:hypothetical protein [Rhizobium sp. PL01]|uniref:hypothetical protein n=1 Tax=Rhizobium sp. PL01 TaxID=3085631 RepID=UPI00298114A1|nr:hypothetical protein [Rhizobium sp. PL01]MDW5312885.1 hypothetical protein [Rhizobium sp. PL01]